jgi:hypothetical protein
MWKSDIEAVVLSGWELVHRKLVGFLLSFNCLSHLSDIFMPVFFVAEGASVRAASMK